MTEGEPNVGVCRLCGDEPMPEGAGLRGLLDHLRLMHPDVYGDGPERWPDGGLVIYEDPETFDRD